MTRRLIGAWAATVVLAGSAGWIGARAQTDEPPTPRTKVDAGLAGLGATIPGRFEAHTGDRFLVGGTARLWTTGRSVVRIIRVSPLGDGVELRQIALAPEAGQNPSFYGAVVDGDLQAQVDDLAGEEAARLLPAAGTDLACCGSSFDVYLDLELVASPPSALLRGLRLDVEVDGVPARVDVIAPVTFCPDEFGSTACRTLGDQASALVDAS